MTGSNHLAMQLMGLLPPELSHHLSLRIVQTGLLNSYNQVSGNRLQTRIAGLDLPNPVGLAAGSDKNALATANFLKIGFGFVEVGCVTPRPQKGNIKPRLFRLKEDHALINRMGLNNHGKDVIAKRLAEIGNNGIVGLNIGHNRISSDPVEDYSSVIETCGPYVDYMTINVSCPNQHSEFDPTKPKILKSLLESVIQTRNNSSSGKPLFLKLSPDLSLQQLDCMVTLAANMDIDGFIATNTTTSRSNLKSPHSLETGGLSGTPLFEKSTRVLAQIYASTEGRLPIIGVGGVRSSSDALKKIMAGASAIQLYTAIAIDGPGVLTEICIGIDRFLHKNGYSTINDIVGKENQEWLN